MKKSFPIGAYHLQKNVRTEENIKKIADCGIDFIIGMEYDPDTLDLFEKYGLGAIISGAVPGWWGGFGENAGKLEETNTIGKYEERAKTFVDHPAIIGLCIGDEPSVLDLPYFGKVAETVSRLFPGKIPYLNLYPSYGVTAGMTDDQILRQLGTPDYGEYIAKYIENVPTDYVSFDYYPYSVTPEGYLKNLRTVSDACRRAKREMWAVVQVNSVDPAVYISENRLRYQAFTAMAFGAARITWACYSAGWWHNNVIDRDGNPTEQYGKLKQVNGEIKNIGKEYVKYRNVATHILDACEELNGDTFKNVRSDSPIAAGEMTAFNGDAHALMLCPIGNPQDIAPVSHKISLRASGKSVTVIGGSGVIPCVKRDGGTCEFTLPASHGALVIAE